jgi:IclR family transcriptional regulator, KDG regulon repressor
MLPDPVESSTKRPSAKTATTVTKVCRIIHEFRENRSFGVTDLAKRTMLLPSDVHRILAALRASGYVEQDPQTRRYRLGFGMLRLGISAFQQNNFRNKAQPVLERLSRQINASVHLGIFDQREMEVMLIDHVDTSTDNLFRGDLGGTVPLHCTAIGKAILAHLDRRTLSRAFENSAFSKNTKNTITDMMTLERQLEQIRLQGYALDLSECREGACCLGSPLMDCSGSVVGAISTSMSTSVFRECDEKWLATRVRGAAWAISAELGAETPLSV